MKNQDKIKILEKPYWDYLDISAYLECGKTKASQIKSNASINGGSIEYFPKYVKINSVLALFGTTREIEIQNLINLRKAINNE